MEYHEPNNTGESITPKEYFETAGKNAPIGQTLNYDNIKEVEENKVYNQFIRSALAVGFTDDQTDFLWEQITKLSQRSALSGGFF